MEDPHKIDLILRILSGEDELTHDPELEEFKASPDAERLLRDWKLVFREAASLLDEMKAWEEMPAERRDEFLRKALQMFRETTTAEDARGESADMPILVEEFFLVDESHKVIPMELREAATPEGISGWIVAADNLAPGALRVRFTEQGKGRLRPTEIVTITVPAVSSAAISSEALAGQSLPGQTDEDVRSAYAAFKSAWNSAGIDHHLQESIEGYVVSQQQGLRVVAFIPASLLHGTGE